MSLFGLFSPNRPPLIQQALDDLRLMLETTREMLAAASACLLEGEPLTLDLKAKDEIVNEKEQAVRRAVLTHLAIAPERDLAFGLTLFSVVQEAERLGDLAKNLAKINALAKETPNNVRLAPLRELRDLVLSMAEDTVEAFVESDTERARSVMERNAEAKERTTAILTALAEDETLGGNEAVVLALAARVIGRCAAHLANVASAVALPLDQLRQSL